MSGTIAGSRLIVGHAEPPGVARHTHPHPTPSEAVGEAFPALADRRPRHQ